MRRVWRAVRDGRDRLRPRPARRRTRRAGGRADHRPWPWQHDPARGPERLAPSRARPPHAPRGRGFDPRHDRRWAARPRRRAARRQPDPTRRQRPARRAAAHAHRRGPDIDRAPRRDDHRGRARRIVARVGGSAVRGPAAAPALGLGAEAARRVRRPASVGAQRLARARDAPALGHRRRAARPAGRLADRARAAGRRGAPARCRRARPAGRTARRARRSRPPGRDRRRRRGAPGEHRRPAAAPPPLDVAAGRRLRRRRLCSRRVAALHAARVGRSRCARPRRPGRVRRAAREWRAPAVLRRGSAVARRRDLHPRPRPRRARARAGPRADGRLVRAHGGRRRRPARPDLPVPVRRRIRCLVRATPAAPRDRRRRPGLRPRGGRCLRARRGRPARHRTRHRVPARARRLPGRAVQSQPAARSRRLPAALGRAARAGPAAGARARGSRALSRANATPRARAPCSCTAARRSPGRC